MRTALLRRRRRGPSLPADLVALLATEPTVLVQLRYNFLAGRYVLFQDPACTVPVEEEGDPIGGVIQPSLTLPPSEWSIVGVQGTDAARAVWGGLDVGAVFDGTAQELRVPIEHPDATPHSVSLMIEAGNIRNNERAYGTGPNFTSIRALDSEGGGWQLRTSAGTNNVELERSIPPGEFHTLTGVHAPTSIVRYRGEEDAGNDGPPVDFLELFIGSRGGSTFAHMQCKWWAFFNRALTLEERIALEALA